MAHCCRLRCRSLGDCYRHRIRLQVSLLIMIGTIVRHVTLYNPTPAPLYIEMLAAARTIPFSLVGANS
jgi:hypothetical protein